MTDALRAHGRRYRERLRGLPDAWPTDALRAHGRRYQERLRGLPLHSRRASTTT